MIATAQKSCFVAVAKRDVPVPFSSRLATCMSETASQLPQSSDASMYRNIELHRNTGTQEGYWTKATRPIYPDLDCRCGVENTSFRVDEP